MKKGAWLVNTARGAICNTEAVAEAVKSGHLLGYGGDVWPVQPAPRDMPWRKMVGAQGRGNAMVRRHSSCADAEPRRRPTSTTSRLSDRSDPAQLGHDSRRAEALRRRHDRDHRAVLRGQADHPAGALPSSPESRLIAHRT